MPSKPSLAPVLLLFPLLSLGSPPTLPGVGAAMQAAVDARDFSGAVTVVVTKEKTIHLEANGFANLGSPPNSMRADSLFWIASMTKPVTGVSVLMLQDEGKLNVADPVAKYLPAFAGLKTPSGRPANLTVAQLLTHISGLGEAEAGAARRASTLAELIPLFLSAPMQYEPGTKWKYTQSGINTARAHRRGRQRHAVRGFRPKARPDPLGMKDTTFYPAGGRSRGWSPAMRKTRRPGRLRPRRVCPVSVSGAVLPWAMAAFSRPDPITPASAKCCWAEAFSKANAT